MTVYFLAQLKFTNRPAYDRYQSRFLPVFKQFQGKVLAADEDPKLFEGSWPYEKVVLLAFPNEQEALRFHHSKEYAEIREDRRAGADATVLLVKGFGES